MRDFVIIDPNKLWFTSDPHFGHANIIKYCHRPYVNVDEMNEAIIKNWNGLVKHDDIIILAGDIAFKNLDKTTAFIDRLNGIKILVRGNHDGSDNIPYTKFHTVINGYFNILVKDGSIDQRITVCHFPMLSWEQSHRGAWNLFGHWHSLKVDGNVVVEPQSDADVALWAKEEYEAAKHLRATQYDVGVDGNDYKPISYYEVKEIITKQIELTKVNNKINR